MCKLFYLFDQKKKMGEMETTEVKIRNEFFISALFVESNISDYLSEKLEINSESSDQSEHKLNFDQKVELILDMDKLSIIDKSKLSVFREIRNEFLLNKNADTIEESFTSPNSNDDFLLILYPQSEYLPREEKLTNACYQLIGEVSQLVSFITNKTEVRLKRSRKIFNFNSSVFSKLAFLATVLFIR